MSGRTPSPQMTSGRSNEARTVRSIEDQSFLILICVISLAFAWILQPFYGSILWGIVATIIFAPLYRWLAKTLRSPAIAAPVTILIITIVILPLTAITASLGREASNLYLKVQSGEVDFVRNAQEILNALPSWAKDMLDRFGLADLSSMREQLTASLVKGSQFLATQALNIGLSTFDFIVGLGVMLYLLFFLLQDSKALLERIKAAVPLREEQKDAIFTRFAIVVRATVKGGILVAIVQGALGGLAFWFLGIHAPLLWAVIMAFLSLLPAIGAGLVWIPVAIYLLATGSVWEGILLVAYGVLVIGLVDNFLRPFLVGKGTKLPDYVVLFSTLGGIKVFGLHGFVIGPVIAAMFMVVWEIFPSSRRLIDKDSAC